MKPFIVVISGKTCSGKTTILNNMLTDKQFSKLVTSTTRFPRAGEVEGEDYYFIQSSLAEHYIDTGKFVESNVHGGQIYGLTESELEEKLKGDRIPCVILTPNGLPVYQRIMEERGIDVLSFYIDASDDLLFTRLANRTESDMAWGALDPLNALKDSLLRVRDMVLKEKDWDSYKHLYSYILDADDDPLDEIKNKVMIYMRRK